MILATRLRNGVTDYVKRVARLSRNCRLGYAAGVLSGVSQGIFAVVFNLYILSLGIEADALGGILSVGPLAQALGSIPAGFLAELIGFRTSFLAIYGIAGLAKLFQVSTTSIPLISSAAFISGLLFSGDFVVRLLFLAANTSESDRNLAYSFSSLIFGLSMSLGSLVAGYVPNLMLRFAPDITVAYRYTLYLAGGLTLLAALPAMWIQEPECVKQRKVSLAPYLWGIDRFTVHQAITSLFVGLSLGTIYPFMNVYFVHHLGTSREFFGTIAALAIVPSTLATAIAPALARRLDNVRAVTLLRFLTIAAITAMAWIAHPLLGMLAYWVQRSLFITAQPLSFAFAMDTAKKETKPAVSAWLNVTFWLGNAVAAPITGSLIARSNYVTPFLLAAAAIFLAGLLNQVYFGPLTGTSAKKAIVGDGTEIKSS